MAVRKGSKRRSSRSKQTGGRFSFWSRSPFFRRRVSGLEEAGVRKLPIAISIFVLVLGTLAILKLFHPSHSPWQISSWIGAQPTQEETPTPPEAAVPLEEVITAALLELGVPETGITDSQTLMRTRVPAPFPSPPGGYWSMEVTLPPSVTPIMANLAVTESVARAGGSVRKAVEENGRGSLRGVLVMDVSDSKGNRGRVVVRQIRERAVAEERDARVAIVIDDFGHNIGSVVQGFLELDVPITFAVLPGLASSEAVAEAAHAQGHEVIVHLPMEPKGYPRRDPGPGAVLVDYPPQKIKQVVRTAIEQVPHAVGMSNHMGSQATQDPEVMRAVMEEAKTRGMFFLDSLTTPYSVVCKVAGEVGVKCKTNDVFIDADVESPDAVRARLDRIQRIAERRGNSVAIGHVHLDTLEMLKEAIPKLQAQGIEFVFLSQLFAPEHGYASS